MANFVVEKLSGLPPHPAEPFYKLFVEGKCFFDEFCREMTKNGNQRKALEKIQVIIVEISLGKRVPTKWFQELKYRGKDDPYRDYEIRCKQLRLYLFEDGDTGKIIVLGELKKGKSTQNKAIRKMREIKLAYFASKE